jgi:hypothetical protein
LLLKSLWLCPLCFFFHDRLLLVLLCRLHGLDFGASLCPLLSQMNPGPCPSHCIWTPTTPCLSHCQTPRDGVYLMARLGLWRQRWSPGTGTQWRICWHAASSPLW